jgi:hypothetical protein
MSERVYRAQLAPIASLRPVSPNLLSTLRAGAVVLGAMSAMMPRYIRPTAASGGPGAGMRIVSENSETDLARQRALDQVDWKIRELTANLLRITRGAGKPYEIMQQMMQLAYGLTRMSLLAHSTSRMTWRPCNTGRLKIGIENMGFQAQTRGIFRSV